ncbi:MAG TPA: hypothetical protein PLK67_08750 [Bryobacteraceae bacterium]|nr:hypothetical protein [Bryobacteraceae bacterium]
MPARVFFAGRHKCTVARLMALSRRAIFQAPKATAAPSAPVHQMLAAVAVP